MPTRLTETFDVQAHRGGSGLTVENTIAAFDAALALGVTTLECDAHLTRDDAVVIAHDRRIGSGPLAGRLIRELTFDELQAVDVGSVRREEFPDRPVLTGTPMPTLREVFDLLTARGADEVGVNLEIKFDAAHPDEGAPREMFVEVVTSSIAQARMQHRAAVQSFDWDVLARVREAEPGISLTVLASNRYLRPGKAGASPWLGGLDIDDFTGSFAAAVASRGFDAISPIHGSPYRSGVDDPSYQPFVTAAMVGQAHASGLRVLPYVVDDVPTMRALVDLGVDGLITNYPDRLRTVLADAGLPLPRAYPG